MAINGSRTVTQVKGPHLIVESLRDEVVIYDRRTNKAHMLDARAASIWQATENGCTFDDLLPLAGDSADGNREALIQLALLDLEEAGLIMTDAVPAMPRRGLLKTLGAAAAVPLVVSILAPTPAAAASNLADAATCSFGDTCATSGRVCIQDGDPVMTGETGKCCVDTGLMTALSAPAGAGATCYINADCCSGQCGSGDGTTTSDGAANTCTGN